MKFTIHHYRFGDYAIELDGQYFTGLCWDEMLGAVARLFYTKQAPPRPLLMYAARTAYSMSVVQVDGGRYWTLRIGDRFCDHLQSDEALGFIAAYTLTEGKRQLYHGFQTYEQWRRRLSLGRDRAISGLLTHQPELVA